MKKLILPAIIAALAILSACGTAADYTREGVTLAAVAGSATDHFVSAVLENTTAQQLCTGKADDFGLEQLQNGKWTELAPETASGAADKSVCYIPGMPAQLDFDWTEKCGSLPAGHYRVVKRFFAGEGEKAEGFYLAAEFDIA